MKLYLDYINKKIVLKEHGILKQSFAINSVN